MLKDLVNKNKEQILDHIYKNTGNLFKNDDGIFQVYNSLNRQYFGVTYIAPVINVPPKYSNEWELIKTIEIESKTLIVQFNNNLRNLRAYSGSLNSLRNIVWILIFSFPITVLYPLSFMPVSLSETPKLTYNIFEIIDNLYSFRMVLLFIFFLCIVSVLFYFVGMIKEMKNNLNATIAEYKEKDYKNIKNYSKYFE